MLAPVRILDLCERGREPAPAVREEEDREDQGREQSRTPIGGRSHGLRRRPTPESVRDRLHELARALRELELRERLPESAADLEVVSSSGKVALQAGRLRRHVVDQAVDRDAGCTTDHDEHEEDRDRAGHPPLHHPDHWVEHDRQRRGEEDPSDDAFGSSQGAEREHGQRERTDDRTGAAQGDADARHPGGRVHVSLG